MTYWQTMKELSTFGFTFVWVIFCFPGLKTVGDFFGCIHRGDYTGALGVVFAVLLWLVFFHFIVAGFRWAFGENKKPPAPAS
ncbi:MAG TPA: hypothetical protein VFF95_17435 [Candidatus Binatus sp.]|nr:hypothetical protein [Candidatus Binatus sp.]